MFQSTQSIVFCGSHSRLKWYFRCILKNESKLYTIEGTTFRIFPSGWGKRQMENGEDIKNEARATSVHLIRSRTWETWHIIFVFFNLLLSRHVEINNKVYYKGFKLFAMGNKKVNCSLIGLGWRWKQVYKNYSVSVVVFGSSVFHVEQKWRKQKTGLGR